MVFERHLRLDSEIVDLSAIITVVAAVVVAKIMVPEKRWNEEK